MSLHIRQQCYHQQFNRQQFIINFPLVLGLSNASYLPHDLIAFLCRRREQKRTDQVFCNTLKGFHHFGSYPFLFHAGVRVTQTQETTNSCSVQASSSHSPCCLHVPVTAPSHTQSLCMFRKCKPSSTKNPRAL